MCRVKNCPFALLVLLLACDPNYTLSICHQNSALEEGVGWQVKLLRKFQILFIPSLRPWVSLQLLQSGTSFTFSSFELVDSQLGEISHNPAQISQSFIQPISAYALQANATNPSVERANAIVQKAIIAHGGETKILAVKDATYEYLVESVGDPPSKPITIKTFFKDDSFFRSEASGDNLDAITILNGDRGWLKVGDTTLTLARKEVDPLKTSMITQLRPELLLLVFPKRRYTGRIDENNRNLDQVEVSGFVGVEYVRGRLSFDTATSQLYKYEYEIERESPKGKGIVKGEETYLRYGEKDGLKFPEEVLSRQVKKASRLKIRNVDFTSPIRADLFQDPNPSPPTPK
jgi:hypothetical protein